PLAFDEPADRTAVAQRQILQLALAALVADRAVERMVDQQELHHVALCLQRLVVAGEDLQPVHDRSGAGRRRLRRPASADLGIDQAHAAVGRDRKLVVVAEARDRNAGLVGGLDDHRTLGRGHLHAIDEDGDVVGRQVRIDGLCAHAATALGTTVPLRSSSTRKRLLTIAYSNSSQKWRRKPCTGQAAASPKAQMVWPSICPAEARSTCRSSTVACMLTTRVIIRYIHP